MFGIHLMLQLCCARNSRIEYAEEIGHHMHAMQVSKPALHEPEENLYEIIPDHLQNSGHATSSNGVNGVNGVCRNGVDHMTPSSELESHMRPNGTAEQNGSLRVNYNPVHVSSAWRCINSVHHHYHHWIVCYIRIQGMST